MKVFLEALHIYENRGPYPGEKESEELQSYGKDVVAPSEEKLHIFID